MFRMKAQYLKFVPREGMRVLVRGKVTLYDARGEYQMVLDHMEEAGEGAAPRLRGAEGTAGGRRPVRPGTQAALLRDAWPHHSPTGAAVRDVLSVLGRRFPLLEVDLPTLVQGSSAAAQITRLLQAADASGRYDVILLTRGGGSLEDLWAFNDEALARAIAASRTPVVSAVGHETDFSLSDFAADLRAPTPSVAAELLVPDQRELALRVRRTAVRMLQLHRHAMQQAMQRADRPVAPERAEPAGTTGSAASTPARSGTTSACRVQPAAGAPCRALRHASAVLRGHHPQRQLDAMQRRLTAVAAAAMQRLLERDALRLRGLARSLEAVSPLATVARGYSILTRSDDGALVRRIDQVQPGDALQARVGDGVIDVQVK